MYFDESDIDTVALEEFVQELSSLHDADVAFILLQNFGAESRFAFAPLHQYASVYYDIINTPRRIPYPPESFAVLGFYTVEWFKTARRWQTMKSEVDRLQDNLESGIFGSLSQSRDRHVLMGKIRPFKFEFHPEKSIRKSIMKSSDSG